MHSFYACGHMDAGRRTDREGEEGEGGHGKEDLDDLRHSARGPRDECDVHSEPLRAEPCRLLPTCRTTSFARARRAAIAHKVAPSALAKRLGKSGRRVAVLTLVQNGKDTHREGNLALPRVEEGAVDQRPDDAAENLRRKPTHETGRRRGERGFAMIYADTAT
eukprot:6209923-Pleurochrysis_carterae.AAC.1